jgi:hypothetical protein
MQFSLNNDSPRVKILGRTGCFAAILFALASAQVGSAQMSSAAESAYIQQVSVGSGTPKYFIMSPTLSTGGQPVSSPHASNLQTPELFTPTRNGNFASSLTIGSFNNIGQIQAGKNDTSAVSILGGKHDNVGVLQTGNQVVSNIALIGMQGYNVGVIQGPNAAPINMLIARLPNGSLLIKR